MRAGRSLLVKVLKGSRSKDVLTRSLDQSPVYGHLKDLPTPEVLKHVDWVILNGYLALEYDGRLPLLVYTPKGWAIERETYAEELFGELSQALEGGPAVFDVSQLKDKNREVILLLLEKGGGERRQTIHPLVIGLGTGRLQEGSTADRQGN